MKSGNLNFPEPSGPLQACNGTALPLSSIKVSEIQELLDKEQAKKFEHFKVLTTTWGSVILTITVFIVSICCSCCCKCCRQCAFWIWDKWTPKECVRQTKERCCVITNINADWVSYYEVPRTPPLTPIFSHSLPYPCKNPIDHDRENLLPDDAPLLG